jgi:subtilisin family serine protease
MTIVAAAGNENNSAVFSPASDSRVVSVAATDNNGIRAGFSNFGKIDVAGPGVGIFSTFYTNSSWGGPDPYGPGTTCASFTGVYASYGTWHRDIDGRAR